MDVVSKSMTALLKGAGDFYKSYTRPGSVIAEQYAMSMEINWLQFLAIFPIPCAIQTNALPMELEVNAWP